MEEFMKIPIQIKSMRFNRVRFKEKRAFEVGWQKNPYTYDEVSNYFPKENYGVLCGKELRVLDDDSPDKKLIKLFIETFGETFRVRDHFYFKFDNEHEKKIIFFDEDNTHLGELQGEGTYVVGAGSIHPSGETYSVKNDCEIKTIPYDKFIEVFGKYLKQRQLVVREHKPTSWEGEDITDIPLGNIISFTGLKDVGGGCYQGSHPEHGSTEGMNFRINTLDNSWYCFRCRAGGGASELIAVMEGVIDCSSSGASCFSEDQAREVIEIARSRYGLQAPERKQDLGEVRGWANSVSILRLAKKHNLENCNRCNKSFKFQDSHGLYYCDYCKYGGGLFKFAQLIQKINGIND